MVFDARLANSDRMSVFVESLAMTNISPARSISFRKGRLVESKNHHIPFSSNKWLVYCRKTLLWIWKHLSIWKQRAFEVITQSLYSIFGIASDSYSSPHFLYPRISRSICLVYKPSYLNETPSRHLLRHRLYFKLSSNFSYGALFLDFTNLGSHNVEN